MTRESTIIAPVCLWASVRIAAIRLAGIPSPTVPRKMARHVNWMDVIVLVLPVWTVAPKDTPELRPAPGALFAGSAGRYEPFTH